METTPQSTEAAVTAVYNRAAHLMVNGKKTAYETQNILISDGMDSAAAKIIVDNLEQQISEAKKSRAQKDIIFGALWCIGGIVMTMAQIGYIFWGAIVFGGIQLVRGLINSQG